MVESITEVAVVRPSKLHTIATVLAAVALESAAIATDAIAAGGHADGGGGVIASDRAGGGFAPRGFEHRRSGRRGYYPFGYYDGYGDYGSLSNNGCISFDAHGCEE